MTTYYIWEMPDPAMLVRVSKETGHDIFANGAWKPTDLIVDYFAGNNDFIEPIEEALAREKYPEAFI